MEPVVQAMEKQYSKDVTFIIVNVDEQQGQELAGMFGVNTIPAFFFLTGDDKVESNTTGPMTEVQMEEAIKALL